MKKTVLTLGIISGIIVSAMLFITFSNDTPDFDSGKWLGYVTMIIALSVIFFAIKTYRDKYNEGRISFGKGFLVGLYVTLIASTMYVISWMIISETTASDFMDQYNAHAIEEMRNNNVPSHEIELEIIRMEQFEKMYDNPFIKAGITYMEILPVGLVISLISAAFLRKKQV